MSKILTGILIIICLVILSGGCASKSASTSSPVVAVSVQSYADPLTENVLLSLAKSDYAGFSADFDQSLKNILTQAVFNELGNQVKANLGEYQSKVFVSSTTQGANTTVLYIAKYAGEPAGVVVTMAFQTVDGTNYVHGVNLDSPKLRGQALDVTQLRAYADSITENILVSLNKNDYAGFPRDFDQTMKNVEVKTAFDSLYSLLKTNVGSYVSQEFENVALQQNYIVVRYLAKYDKEPDGVWITISFDNNHQVAGLYFDSPKLRAK